MLQCPRPVLQTSLVYRVVQSSFHDRQQYPFVDTETKGAYTIIKAVFINHIFALISYTDLGHPVLYLKVTSQVKGIGIMYLTLE